MSVQDPVRELLDLVAVHKFYVDTLQTQLGFPVPLPKEAMDADARAELPAVNHSIQILRRWLAVLDLAVPPVVIRDALKISLPQETSEALLRYFVDKSTHTESDRDKADCLITQLFKNSEIGKTELPESGDRYVYILELSKKFETEVFRILGDASPPELRAEHAQLLREFEFLHQEIEDYRSFDQLTDSGIIQRVRDIKQTLADSFFHPDVLAHVAVYNTMFGRRFDQLFRAAADQIKNFAAKVQDEGASIMSRLEGDVTVKHLTDVKEEKIISQEYGKAQEHFRNVSKLKKVVDKRGKGREPAAAPAPVAAPPQVFAPPASAPAATSGGSMRSQMEPLSAAPMRSVTNALEDGKLRVQLDAIRTFVRLQDKTCHVVPLVKGHVNISPAEAEALRAEFGTEKSFRADHSEVMSTMVALMARMVVEEEEFKAKQGSEYLWKPHADSITYVMQTAKQIIEKANEVLAVAEKRGLEEKATALKATVVKLRAAVTQTAYTLRNVGAPSAPVS